MNQYKKLIGNIAFLTLSNFASKILTFLLVPLYTSILSTGEYGAFDLINTIVLLCTPIFTLSIQEGILRFSLEKDADYKKIMSIGFKYGIIGTICIVLVIALNALLKINTFLMTYSIPLFLLYLTASYGGIISYFVRGLGEVKSLSIGSCISVFGTILFNILFLVVFRFGLNGYFAATILGNSVSIIYYVFRHKLWNYVSMKTRYREYEKRIVQYSSPMIANTISWWVNGAADRLFVTIFCGISENGIYSVAHKIPSILTTVQGIFSQAWSISAVQDFDSEDRTGFYSNTYLIYNSMLVLICSLAMIFNKFIAKMMFAKDFYSAWEIAPFLIISTLFSGMSGYLGGILSALKKTDTFAKTSVLTAGVNVILNFILVPSIGTLGASISTAVAFVIMWAERLHTVKRYVKLDIKLYKDLLGYGIIIVQASLLIIMKSEKVFSGYQFVLCFILFMLYAKDYYLILQVILKKIKERNGHNA